MIKFFCDRCGEELDHENMKYACVSFKDYESNTTGLETWDFCHECASSIKHSMVKNIAEHNKEKQGALQEKK